MWGEGLEFWGRVANVESWVILETERSVHVSQLLASALPAAEKNQGRLLLPAWRHDRRS